MANMNEDYKVRCLICMIDGKVKDFITTRSMMKMWENMPGVDTIIDMDIDQSCQLNEVAITIY